jgi:pyridoxine kinase
VLSGYLGSAANGAAIIDAVRAVKAANPQAVYCCDPVMGESGRGYYVAEGIPAFFAERALPLADILLPNRFEIEVLAGRPCPDLASSAAAAKSLLARGPKLVIVTGLPVGARRIAAMAVDKSGVWVVDAPRLELSAHGAGDTFAALFLGYYLRRRSPGRALARAMSAQHAIMRASARRGGAELQIIAAQDAFARPKTLFKAKRLR